MPCEEDDEVVGLSPLLSSQGGVEFRIGRVAPQKNGRVFDVDGAKLPEECGGNPAGVELRVSQDFSISGVVDADRNERNGEAGGMRTPRRLR